MSQTLRLIRGLRVGAVVVASLALFGSLAIVLGLVDRSGKGIYAVAKMWFRTIVSAAGVKIVVTGKPPEQGPVVVMANHASHLDVIALTFALSPLQLRWVAKKELLRVPIFGQALRRAGQIIIDRSAGRGAVEAIFQTARQLPPDSAVAFFPEGTRSPDGHLGEFKKGGFLLAREHTWPILPIGIRGSRDLLPKGSLIMNKGIIHVAIGAPIDPKNFSDSDCQDVIHFTRNKIEELVRSVD